MTLFLASVATLAELEIGLTAGADIIDLKDPEKGALGAWSLDKIARAVGIVAGRCRVSAAAGDPVHPVNQGKQLEDDWTAFAASGVDTVKFAMGFDGYDPQRLEMVARIAWGSVQPVAVVAVDKARQSGVRLDDSAWLAQLTDAGCRGVMLDTADKAVGRLTDYVPFSVLSAFVMAGRSLGLEVGLAGSLCLEDSGLINRLAPDVAGFRGALCAQGDRTGRLVPERVRHLKAALHSADHSAEYVAASQATATAGPQSAIRAAKSASEIPRSVSTPT